MEEDHSTPSSLWCSYSCCNGSKAADIAALFLSTLLHTLTFSLHFLLSHNASIYRHFMAAVLALLSALVVAKLQLIQQWWLPTPPLLQQ